MEASWGNHLKEFPKCTRSNYRLKVLRLVFSRPRAGNARIFWPKPARCCVSAYGSRNRNSDFALLRNSAANMWENGGCLPGAKITALLFLRKFTQFPCPNLSEDFLADYFRSIRPDLCALWGCDERTVVERLYWRSQGVAVIVKKLN